MQIRKKGGCGEHGAQALNVPAETQPLQRFRGLFKNQNFPSFGKSGVEPERKFFHAVPSENQKFGFFPLVFIFNQTE